LREAFDGAEALRQRARAAGALAYSDADYDLAMALALLGQVLEAAGGSEQALPLLDEARQRFEAVAKASASKAAEGMAAVCFCRKGNCLLYLGRLDKAEAAYEEAIRRLEQVGDDRGAAVGKAQLGTVHMQQRRYGEALAAYTEARERFTALDEPGSVAVIWHQTGMVYQYQEAGQPEAAEDAYRKSLAINVRLGNIAGQASTLVLLGNLYNDALSRPEEAVSFYRQAADKYAETGDVGGEGGARSNIGKMLCKLRRFDEARQEICRAIACKEQFGHAAEPWKTWGILADIETDAGNATAAAEARAKAITCYLAYRRDGGENHSDAGRDCFVATQAVLAGDMTGAMAYLQEQAAAWEAADCSTFIPALQAIVAGSRDRALAAAADLPYEMTAEILFLIETLEGRG